MFRGNRWGEHSPADQGREHISYHGIPDERIWRLNEGYSSYGERPVLSGGGKGDGHDRHEGAPNI